VQRVDRFQSEVTNRPVLRRVESLQPRVSAASEPGLSEGVLPTPDEPEDRAILSQLADRADKVTTLPVANAIEAVANRDVFAASKAVREITARTPGLAPIRAVADILVLSHSEDAARKELEAASKDVDVLVSEQASGTEKVNSGINLANRMRNAIQVGEVVVEASRGLSRMAARVEGLGVVVQPLRSLGAAIARSPVGAIGSALGKLVPYLNIAATLTSYRNLWRIAHDRDAGTMTRTLAVGSAVAGTGLAVASFAPPLAPLVLPLALAGLACDAGLIWSESKDQERARTTAGARIRSAR
jgi:hypothetical protein